MRFGAVVVRVDAGIVGCGIDRASVGLVDATAVRRSGARRVGAGDFGVEVGESVAKRTAHAMEKIPAVDEYDGALYIGFGRHTCLFAPIAPNQEIRRTKNNPARALRHVGRGATYRAKDSGFGKIVQTRRIA